MKIIISNGSSVPIYQQIYENIRQNIVDGTLQTNDMLPSIRTLAKDIGVSVITAKKAYEELENSGYIQTAAGKGSFVSEMSHSLIRENMLSIMEQSLLSAIDTAKKLSLTKEELTAYLQNLYEEDF